MPKKSTGSAPSEARATSPCGQAPAHRWLAKPGAQGRRRETRYGKAAELAGMPKAEFVLLMGRHGASPFDYDPDDVEEELRAAHEVAGRARP